MGQATSDYNMVMYVSLVCQPFLAWKKGQVTVIVQDLTALVQSDCQTHVNTMCMHKHAFYDLIGGS